MSKEMEMIDEIIFRIHSGKYKTNEKLPSENSFAKAFNVPRMTVRKVFERLQEIGYIYSIQGKGTYVKDRGIQIPLFLAGDKSFSKKMEELGVRLQSKNIFCERIDYQKDIYSSLGVKPTETVVKIGRLRIVDDLPIALHISYVAEKILPTIVEDGESIVSMFDYYQKQGYSDFASKPSILKVQFPTQFLRETLQANSLIPLLVLETGCIDRNSGTLLEHTEIYYRSDYFHFVLNL